MAANEVAEAQGVGTSLGIAAGVIIVILIIIGLVYLRLWVSHLSKQMYFFDDNLISSEDFKSQSHRKFAVSLIDIEILFDCIEAFLTD